MIKMTRSIVISSLLFLQGVFLLVHGQQPAKQPASRLTNNPSPDATDGAGVSHLHPREEMTSLSLVTTTSPVIVDGTVTAVLPAVRRTSHLPNAIETHSLVSVRETLKGDIPGKSRVIVIAQEGGKLDEQERLTDDPLVTVGERYILFLAPDQRTQPSNATGAPRYYTVGIWAGKAKIENNRVTFPGRAAPALHENDGLDVSVFVGKLKDIISNTTIPTKRNAIPHPGLPSRP